MTKEDMNPIYQRRYRNSEKGKQALARRAEQDKALVKKARQSRQRYTEEELDIILSGRLNNEVLSDDEIGILLNRSRQGIAGTRWYHLNKAEQ